MTRATASRTSMFKNILAGIIMCSLLALILCAATSCTPSNEDVIRSSIAEEFDSYKNADDEAMTKIAEAAEKEGMTDLGIDGGEFASAVLEGFDYRIDDIAIDGEVANATITIVSKSVTDFQEKLTSAVDEFANSSEAQTMSSEEKNEKIGDIAMQAFKDTEIVEEQAVLTFELDGNVWTCTNINEVLSGLDSLVFAN